MSRNRGDSNRITLLAAFAAIYFIWGSTYLAIRFAIETIPPFLMAGSRFILAGAILFIWAWSRGDEVPSRKHWRPAFTVGGLLLLGGNGGVTWAEQSVPSGVTALLVATVPLWIALLEWVKPGGRKPASRVFMALFLGFIGTALLIGPQALSESGKSNPLGTIVVILASLSWAAGSLHARQADLPSSPLISTAMQMLCGGFLLILAGTFAGEWATLNVRQWSLRSILSFGYLIVFGSLVAFTAYIWLLKATTPTLASTYAYVNPVVAVFLGWTLGSEVLSSQTILAAGIIISSVIVVTSFRPR